MIGISGRYLPFQKKIIKILGFDISKMVFGEIVTEYKIPILFINGKNDQELDFNKAKISAALLSHKNYKVISKIKTYLFESEGLG